MSEKWHGGKGDSTRVSNWDAYRENYDRIFRKKKQEEPKEEVKEEDTEEEPEMIKTFKYTSNLVFWSYTLLSAAIIIAIAFIVGDLFK